MAQSVPVQKLNREHRHFSENREIWKSLDLLYRGGPALQNEAARFLRKRPKEQQDVYLQRVAEITYENLLGTVLGWYQSFLFRRDPEIDLHAAGSIDPYTGANEKFYTDFLSDCDRSGTTFVDQWRLIALWLMLFREAYICVDLPNSDTSEYVSLNQQKKSGALDPYLMAYGPQNVINWQVDDYGNFEWILIKIQRFEHQFLGDANSIERWYYYDRSEYRVYEVSQAVKEDSGSAAQIVGPDGRPVSSDKATADLVAQGRHALADQNRVPVRYVCLPEGLHLAARAYLPALAHLNIENGYYWSLNQGNMPIPLYKSNADLQTNVRSETSYFQIEPGDSFEYIEPSGRTYDVSQRCLGQLREEIYRQMYLMAQGRDSSASASAQSGYSKEMDQMPSREVCSAIGDVVRATMQLVLTDVRDARGDSDVEFDVRGFVFQESNLVKLLEEQALLDSAGVQSDELHKERHKQIAIAALPDANRSVIDKVLSEIEAAPTLSEQQAAAQASMKLQMDRTLTRNVTAVGQSADQAA